MRVCVRFVPTLLRSSLARKIGTGIHCYRPARTIARLYRDERGYKYIDGPEIFGAGNQAPHY